MVCGKISSTRRDNLTTDTTRKASIVRSGFPQARIAVHMATVGNVGNRDGIGETQGTSMATMRLNRKKMAKHITSEHTG
jgi:nitrous oxidase accessory protein NosD